MSRIQSFWNSDKGLHCSYDIALSWTSMVSRRGHILGVRPRNETRAQCRAMMVRSSGHPCADGSQVSKLTRGLSLISKCLRFGKNCTKPFGNVSNPTYQGIYDRKLKHDDEPRFDRFKWKMAERSNVRTSDFRA